MAKSNRQYWIDRALRRERESYLRGAALSDKLFRVYQRAARAIRKDVEAFYARYASENGITYEQAVKLMNRPEMQEWKATLGEYVDRINGEADPAVRARLKAELDALSYNSRITRLGALEGQINLTLNDLYDRGVQEMRAEFGEEFVQSYYHKLYDLQCRAGLISAIAKLTPRMVENVVSYPWSGAHFSDRLWQNKQALLFNVREIITQGVIQGKSINTMSRELSARMGQSYKNAERLIRTENNHFHNAADIGAYEVAGVEQYEYMATLDDRTSDVCADLDGKTFPVKEAQAGVNYPPMHANCRSTTIEHDPEEEQDWINSGLEMPKRMTYREWATEQGIDPDAGRTTQQEKPNNDSTAE